MLQNRWISDTIIIELTKYKVFVLMLKRKFSPMTFTPLKQTPIIKHYDI